MAFSFNEWSMRSLLMWKTWRRGEFVGEDHLGNRYYRDRKLAGTKRERRWIVYKGESEASVVPPEWHGWLHHQTDEFPDKENPYRRVWQVEHEPNMTGTMAAYRPPGSVLRGGNRAPSSGDYEPWTPE